MAEMFYLSDRDRSLFDEMARDYLSRKRASKTMTEPFRSPQAPDVYLAKVPPSGIPALSQTETTGTGTDQPLDDVPGAAECEIYQFDVTAATPSFGRVGDLTYWVRNLSTTALSADSTPWVLVIRDKFGEWFVPPGRGSGADLDFEDFTETVNVVTAVVSRECGLLVKNTPFTFNFTLPVGSSVSVTVGSGDTGTGSATDGDDTVIDFQTRLITYLSDVNVVTDLSCVGGVQIATTTVTKQFTTDCVLSGGLECCPDYTGTGTS